MKVRIIQSGGYTGRDGRQHVQGAIADMPDELAAKLARMRIVEIVRDKPAERAVRQPAETTAQRGPGRPRKEA